MFGIGLILILIIFKHLHTFMSDDLKWWYYNNFSIFRDQMQMLRNIGQWNMHLNITLSGRDSEIIITTTRRRRPDATLRTDDGETKRRPTGSGHLPTDRRRGGVINIVAVNFYSRFVINHRTPVRYNNIRLGELSELYRWSGPFSMYCTCIIS